MKKFLKANKGTLLALGCAALSVGSYFLGAYKDSYDEAQNILEIKKYVAEEVAKQLASNK